MIQNLSSLSLILISYVKDILIVLIAWICIPSETLNDIELEGYTLEIIGLATWKYIAFTDYHDKETVAKMIKEKETSSLDDKKLDDE